MFGPTSLDRSADDGYGLQVRVEVRITITINPDQNTVNVAVNIDNLAELSAVASRAVALSCPGLPPTTKYVDVDDVPGKISHLSLWLNLRDFNTAIGSLEANVYY